MEEPKVFGRDHQLYRMAKNGSKALSCNETCTILFLSFFLFAMGRRNKENEPPIIILNSGSNTSKAKGKRTQWNKMTLSVLLDTLAQQKAAGNQTDNAAWKADAWTACEAALASTESGPNGSGGPPKTAKMCSTRWVSVRRHYFFPLGV
jgi:hypothetical protein